MELQTDMVRTIVSRYGPTAVCAGQFFVSWNSVLTLAYTGFSLTLLALKRGIDAGIPGLAEENSGSKWPKTTLGCLNDNVELTETQIHVLRSVCEEHNKRLRNVGTDDRTMDIKELTCVTFHCRTLERRLCSECCSLGGEVSGDDNPPESHLQIVADTMAQFDAKEHVNYYEKLAPNGRTIGLYYRASHVESSLVYDLAASAVLYDSIAEFRLAVDEALPGCYAWFDPDSWHMTVRSLVMKE